MNSIPLRHACIINGPVALLTLVFLILLIPWQSQARTPLTAGPASPVDHPAAGPGALTSAQYRRAVGDFGETLVEESLRLRGFQEVVEVKSGNQGIDRIAVKRNRAGNIIDVRIVEVKTSRRAGQARMSNTTHGPQMGQNWLDEKFRQMRASPDLATRRLVDDIRAMGRTPEQLGRIYDVNTRSGAIVIRTPGGRVWGRSTIERYLTRVANIAKRPDIRLWAQRNLDQYQRILQSSMKDLVERCRRAVVTAAQSVAARARLQSQNLASTGDVAGQRSPRLTWRLAARAGVAGGVVIATYQSGRAWLQYRRGDITRREFHEIAAGGVGGVAGAAAGAYAGAQIGMLFGPGAVVMAPVGAITGGIVGYLIGERSGQASAAWYYQRLDKSVRDELHAWMGEVYSPR